MAGVAEFSGRPIAIATFATNDVYGTVSFLPEPGAGVHVYASLAFNDKYCGKTLGMHVHDSKTGGHFAANPNSRHGVWPDGHVGDLHNNIAVSDTGHVLLSFVDSRLSVMQGTPRCILGQNVTIHTGHDDCGVGTDVCSHVSGCAGPILASAKILAWGGLVDSCA